MVCISLPILVVIAGVYLLAKTKTDNLGTGFKFASYASILAGLVMLGMSLMMCMSNCCGNKGDNRPAYHQSCKGNDGCSGATCSKGDKCTKNAKCSKSPKCSKSDKCKKKEACKYAKDSTNKE